MPRRVLIAGFKHETNTFSKLATDLDSYRARGLAYGDEIVEAYRSTNTEIAAFLNACARHDWTPVLSVVADAVPSVFPDLEAIARAAADHLVARGFRKFGYVGYNTAYERALRNAFKACLQEAGYPCTTLQVSDRYNTGAKAWRRYSTRLENWVASWSSPIGVSSTSTRRSRGTVPSSPPTASPTSRCGI